MERIGIISNTSKAIDFAKDISHASGYEIIVDIGFPNTRVLKKAQRMEKELQVSAIIAPGAIYDEIYTHMDVPVIRLQLTNFEIAKALHQASKLGEKIVFVDFLSTTSDIDVYDPDSVKDMFDYNMDRIAMKSPDEIDGIVSTIFDHRYDVVLSNAKCLLDAIPAPIHTLKSSMARQILRLLLHRRSRLLKSVIGRKKNYADADYCRDIRRGHDHM